jgi:hypothetical protein
MLEVRQVNATRRLALLRLRLSTPKTIVGETVREVAKVDLRPESRGRSSETIGATPRADSAGDSNDDKGVMGEANPGCPWADVRLLFPARQAPDLSGPKIKSIPSVLRKYRSFPNGAANGSNRPTAMVRDAKPRTNGAPTEFQVDSADVRVLEFIELVSPNRSVARGVRPSVSVPAFEEAWCA